MWNSITKKYRAASIRFINEVDDEEIPPLPPHFRYIESHYAQFVCVLSFVTFVFTFGILFLSDNDIPSAPEGAFMTCDCKTCFDPAKCGCQLDDDDTPRVFAYDDDVKDSCSCQSH
jgi:hypothetical protein